MKLIDIHISNDKVFSSLNCNSKVVVVIGNFDGLHKGHQKLLKIAKKEAANLKLPFGIVTFDPHPRDFFNPKNYSFKLLDSEEKQILLSKLDVEFLIIIEFNEQLKNCNPEYFLSQILKENFNIVKMFAGSNFKFGKNREGNIQLLKETNKLHPFNLEEIKAHEIDEIKISSTKIRQAIDNGNIHLFKDYCGRFFEFSGKIIYL